jgi:AcrR family transcriptional regulator
MTTSKESKMHQETGRSQELILAAYQTIAEKGFEGLRVRDVAAQVGINPATLHHYFPTKEALVQEVALYVSRRLAQITTSTEGTPMDQLRIHLNALQRQMEEEPALFIALREIGLRAQRDPAIRAAALQRVEEWHAILVSILHAGIKQGCWSDDLDAHAAASAITALIQGVSLNASLLPDKREQAFRQLKQWLKL